jgi:hypothetical protein
MHVLLLLLPSLLLPSLLLKLLLLLCSITMPNACCLADGAGVSAT